MPSTLVGLTIFVVLLAPGFCYVLRREQVYPGRKHSVFRETVMLVFAGLASNTVVLALFGLFRTLFPQQTPDVGRLVREPDVYFRESYLPVTWWAVGLILAACALAVVAVDHPDWLHRKMRAGQEDVRHASAWWIAFENHPDRKKKVVCKLTDGSTVEGMLSSYSHESEETSDRELILGPPLAVVEADGTRREDAYGGLIVSARSMLYMYVDYVE